MQTKPDCHEGGGGHTEQPREVLGLGVGLRIRGRHEQEPSLWFPQEGKGEAGQMGWINNFIGYGGWELPLGV
jgi:hypothetical protein